MGSHNYTQATASTALVNFEKVQQRMKQAFKQQIEAEAQFNRSQAPCTRCGHKPRTNGGRLYCCEHYLDALRAAVPPADPVADVPGGMGMPWANLGGLAITLEPPPPDTAKHSPNVLTQPGCGAPATDTKDDKQ